MTADRGYLPPANLDLPMPSGAAIPPAGDNKLEDCICTGFDVPIDPLTAEDIAFWTGSPRYQPWKDVAQFFPEFAHFGGESGHDTGREEHAAVAVRNVREHELFNEVTDATWTRLIAQQIRIALYQNDEQWLSSLTKVLEGER